MKEIPKANMNPKDCWSKPISGKDENTWFTVDHGCIIGDEYLEVMNWELGRMYRIFRDGTVVMEESEEWIDNGTDGGGR